MYHIFPHQPQLYLSFLLSSVLFLLFWGVGEGEPNEESFVLQNAIVTRETRTAADGAKRTVPPSKHLPPSQSTQ